jgi:hypothetical protein
MGEYEKAVKKIKKMKSKDLDLKRKEMNNQFKRIALKELQRRGYLKKKIKEKSGGLSFQDLMKM